MYRPVARFHFHGVRWMAWSTALVFVSATLGALRPADADSGDPAAITVQDSQTKQLLKVTPSVVLSGQLPSLDLTPLPLVPIGYDLGEKSSTAKHPAEIREGAPLKLDAYWRVTAQTPRNVALRMRVAGSGPAYEQTYSVDTTEWKMGGAYRTSLVLTPKGSRYAGDATVSLLYRAAPESADSTLLLAPVAILPVVAKATAPADRLREVFGANAVRLNVALRLGKGAGITIPVPKDNDDAFSGIGIVSAVGYSGFFDPGAPVLRVECSGVNSSCETLSLLYGKGTLHGETKATPLANNTLDNVEIFASENPAANAPTRRTFTARLIFAKPRRPDNIHLTYLPQTGVLDIAEILLLK